MVKYLIFFLSWTVFIGQTLHAQVLRQDKTSTLVFDVYNKNMHVVVIHATYQLLKDQYKVTAHFASAGLVGFFVSLDMTSSVNGRIQDGHVAPEQYESKGKSKGEKFKTLIDFHDGQKTEVVTLLPGKEKNRDSLNQDQMDKTIDILSAMIELIHQVRTENKCDDSFQIFDGIRVFKFQSQTVGDSPIPSTWTSPYQGQALLCSAVARQTGGLKQSRHRALMARPQPGYLWFKSVDGVGMLPVRFEFDHPKMGKVIVILRNIARS